MFFTPFICSLVRLPACVSVCQFILLFKQFQMPETATKNIISVGWHWSSHNQNRISASLIWKLTPLWTWKSISLTGTKLVFFFFFHCMSLKQCIIFPRTFFHSHSCFFMFLIWFKNCVNAFVSVGGKTVCNLLFFTWRLLWPLSQRKRVQLRVWKYVWKKMTGGKGSNERLITWLSKRDLLTYTCKCFKEN